LPALGASLAAVVRECKEKMLTARRYSINCCRRRTTQIVEYEASDAAAG
jgi:hypothetical protein